MEGGFWKPGTIPNLRETGEEEVVVPFNKNSQLSLERQRLLLPIASHRREILYCVEKFDVLILIGQTGSGKVVYKNLFLSF